MLALAASAADSDLPVIVIPAQSQIKMPAFQASAWDFLSNPFGLLECQTRIRNWLEVRPLYLRLQAHNDLQGNPARERPSELRES